MRMAKRLISRQAQWALFFDHFNFALSYRPGSKNGKADSHSRIHDKDDQPSSTDFILPITTARLGAAHLDIKQEVISPLEN